MLQLSGAMSYNGADAAVAPADAAADAALESASTPAAQEPAAAEPAPGQAAEPEPASTAAEPETPAAPTEPPPPEPEPPPAVAAAPAPESASAPAAQEPAAAEPAMALTNTSSGCMPGLFTFGSGEIESDARELELEKKRERMKTIDKMPKKRVKGHLEELGLSTKGTHDDLVARYKKAVESESKKAVEMLDNAEDDEVELMAAYQALSAQAAAVSIGPFSGSENGSEFGDDSGGGVDAKQTVGRDLWVEKGRVYSREGWWVDQASPRVSGPRLTPLPPTAASIAAR